MWRLRNASPLTALFDTGPVPFAGRSATIWRRHFLD
jgi:hypothetical protein